MHVILITLLVITRITSYTPLINYISPRPGRSLPTQTPSLPLFAKKYDLDLPVSNPLAQTTSSSVFNQSIDPPPPPPPSTPTTSVLSSTLLISGTTIGAGILALPTLSLPSGFIPSTITLVGCWGVMAVSALLLAEVQISLTRKTSRTSISLLDSTLLTLGPIGYLLTTLSYLFLHVSLLTAYVSSGSSVIPTLQGCNEWASPSLFTLLTICPIYFLPPNKMNALNNLLVISAILTFAFLCVTGLPTMDTPSLLSSESQNPTLLPPAVPVMLLSLVYHNVIPTVVTQQSSSPSRIRTCVVAGSGIPLLMFVAYNAVVMGNVMGDEALVSILRSGGAADVDPISVLSRGGNDNLTIAVKAFSELAVVTSLIGFVYGLRDAVCDILKITDLEESSKKLKPLVYSIVALPPLLMAVLLGDGVFLEALGLGGVYGVSFLFLVVPSLMSWVVRYGEVGGSESSSNSSINSGSSSSSSRVVVSEGGNMVDEIVGGGKFTLVGLGTVGVGIIAAKVLGAVG